MRWLISGANTLNNDKMVTITNKHYVQLLKDEAELAALHAGGVENWEWYGDSLRDAGLMQFDDEPEESEDD